MTKAHALRILVPVFAQQGMLNVVNALYLSKALTAATGVYWFVYSDASDGWKVCYDPPCIEH